MIPAPSLRASFVLLLSVGLLACDGGFSDEAATARCDQERSARGGAGEAGCMTDDAYAECIAAHTECGDEVLIAESCPTQFSCVEE